MKRTEPLPPTVCANDKCLAPVDVRKGVALCLHGHRYTVPAEGKPEVSA